VLAHDRPAHSHAQLPCSAQISVTARTPLLLPRQARSPPPAVRPSPWRVMPLSHRASLHPLNPQQEQPGAGARFCTARPLSAGKHRGTRRIGICKWSHASPYRTSASIARASFRPMVPTRFRSRSSQEQTPPDSAEARLATGAAAVEGLAVGGRHKDTPSRS